MGRQKKAAVVSACMMFVMAGLVWGQGPCTAGIETVAGYVPLGDGGPATAASVMNPGGVAVDAAGNLYIADTDNHRIRKVTTAGVITTVAGNGLAGAGGDGGQAIFASLEFTLRSGGRRGGESLHCGYREPPHPEGDADGDHHDGGRHRHVWLQRGRGASDGGAACINLLQSDGVAVDAAGNLYIADTDNHRIRKVTPAGVITTVAGTGTYGYSGDGGPATAAQLATILRRCGGRGGQSLHRGYRQQPHPEGDAGGDHHDGGRHGHLWLQRGRRSSDGGAAQAILLALRWTRRGICTSRILATAASGR
jgi:DNA-binding beta-propeller fold protein YncE